MREGRVCPKHDGKDKTDIAGHTMRPAISVFFTYYAMPLAGKNYLAENVMPTADASTPMRAIIC